MSTQLSLYNGALRLLKHRRLATTLDDDPARYLLDEVYVDALDYVAEQGSWNFLSVSASLSASVNANRGYTNRATKPAGFVRLISISDNSAYYPPLEAYAEDRDYFFCNVANIYVVHTSRLAASATVTITIASPGVVTHTNHGLVPNAPYVITTTGALPTGLTAGTTYYVKTVLTTSTFTLSATPGGSVINTSGSQSGTHTGQAQFGGNISKWPETYARAVEAYLAQQVAPHLTNSDAIVARVTDAYEAAIQLSLAKDAINRTMRVVSATTLSIYNGALRLLGQRLLANFDDDVVLSRVADPTGEPPSQQSRGRPPTLPSLQVGREMSLRRLLDESYDSAVQYCLEQAQWMFAAKSATIATTATPGFGYARRGTKPSDLVRLISISSSSSFFPPLEDYAEDGTLWYAAASNLYVTYVSNDASYGTNTTLWPETFQKLVEVQLALEIVPSLSPAPDLLKYLGDEYAGRFAEARAKDAMNRTARVVTAATLSVYNGALRLLGKRLLSTTTDDIIIRRLMPAVVQQQDGRRGPPMPPSREIEREVSLRTLLDETYTDSHRYILEQAQWSFASKSTTLAASANANRGYSNRATKPTDLVRLTSISSSSSYYPPLEDYSEDHTYWFTNVANIYIVYTSDDAAYGGDLTKWPASVQRALEAYLALQIAPHADVPLEVIGYIRSEYDRLLQEARAREAINRTMRVVSATTLSVYNGALRLLGQRLLANFDDDVVLARMADPLGEPPSGNSKGRPPSLPSIQVGREMSLRRLLDEAYDGALAHVLEQGLWTFAARGATVSTSVAAGFGYARTGVKPADLVRLISISSSSSYFPPLEEYAEDGTNWYTAASNIYINYVSDNASYGADTTKWPASFRRTLEAYLAFEIAPHIGLAPDLLQAIDREYSLRLTEARAKDCINKTARVVTAATLSVYNGALRLLGKRLLTTNTDDIIIRRLMPAPGQQDGRRGPPAPPSRETEMDVSLRTLLDEAYTDSHRYLLEQAQWSFASKSTTLAASANANRGYSNRATKPTDLVRLISISSSSSYYPPLEDYSEDHTYWFTNVANIYIVYTSDDAAYGGDLTKWPASVQRALEAYLALQIAPHADVAPEMIGYIRSEYDRLISEARAREAVNRTMRVLSTATLSVYNGALRLLGQRLLTNFDDDIVISRVADPIGEPPSQQSRGRPPTLPSLQVGREMSLRRLLDESYDSAVQYCLEQAQWMFAAKSATISTTATPGFGYARRGTKPSDLVRLIAISASSSFYPPLEAYAEDGTLWYAADSTLYVTYVSNDASYGLSTTLWPETFTRLVEAQLALEIVPSLAPTPELLKYLESVAASALEEARAKDAINRVARVVSSTTLSVYNGALRLLGKRLLSNFDDSTVASRQMVIVDGKPVMMAQRDVEMEMTLRRLLDEAYDGAVNYLLAQGLWNFASRAVAIEEESAVEPQFGYSYIFEKPSDFIRLVSIGSTGDLYPTLNDYLDEGNYWHANITPLYVQYVSNDASYGLDTSLWPVTFTRALEAYLAKELAPHAGLSAAKMEVIDKEYAFRIRDARSKDAMNQAAMRPPPGRLTRSRGGSRYYNDQRRQN